jgi:hypothetical protein
LKITTTYDFNKLRKGDNPINHSYDASWYQFTFHTYAKDTTVQSWRNNQQEEGYKEVAEQWKNTGDPKPIGDNDIQFAKTATILSGTAETVFELKGAGSISQIKFHLDNYSRDLFFNTHIRIFWDNAAVPAVDMPLANFFGGGGENYSDCQDIHTKSLHTLMYGFNGQTHDFYCYWPMPYWQSARIELRNGSKENLDAIKINVAYKPANVYQYARTNAGYFYAKRTISKDSGQKIFATAFRESGRGHVAGISFYSTGYAMDGDEFAYIDGSGTPQVHGDGTEDDHNQGWGGFAYQAPLWGGLVNGFQGAYRIYLNDSYIFNKDIKINYEFSMEGGTGYGGEVDAVVYYYKSPSSGNLILTDEIDVGSTAAEKKHHYIVSGKTWAQTKTSGYDSYEREYSYDVVRDNGYAYNKYSEFTAAISPANEGVRLRRRIYRSDNGVQRANVYVNGVIVKERPWDICTLSSAPFYQGWFDDDFEIPVSYTKGKRSINIRIEYLNGGSKAEINEFYFWVYSYANGGKLIKEPVAKALESKDSPTHSSSKPQQAANGGFLLTDTSTLGSWAGKYGFEGFVMPQYFFGHHLQFFPDYVSDVAYGKMKGHQFSTWNSSTVSSLNPNPINYQ